MRLPLYHVNAFTTQPFSGNPAAVCPLDRWLDDQFLRKVAAENNFSATAFLVQQAGRYELRWFTSRCEIRLCGHATLASALVIMNILKPDVRVVHFETRWGGTLTVRRDGELLVMDFPVLQAEFVKPPDKLIRAIGTAPPPDHVLQGNDTYIVVYKDQTAVQDLRPDFALFEALHPFVVAVTARGNDVDFVSRYFAPSYGVPEDPVTGSVHCALTPYWANRLGKTKLHARQLSGRDGELWCELARDRIVLSGYAVLTMQGELVI